jgi:hypothetical protein
MPSFPLYPAALANLFKGSTLDPDLAQSQPVSVPSTVSYKRADPAVAYRPHSYTPKGLERHQAEFRKAFQSLLTQVESELRAHAQSLPSPTVMIPGNAARVKGSSRKASTPVAVLRYGRTDMIQVLRRAKGEDGQFRDGQTVLIHLDRLDEAQARLAQQVARLTPPPVEEPEQVPIPVAAE